MASVSVNASVVDHVLPTYFAGIGLAYLNSGDFAVQAYRNALTNLNPEVIRLNPFHSPGTVASPNSNFTNMRDLCAFLGTNVGVWMGTTGAHPIGTPSAISEVSTTNYEADGGGRSPNDSADWLANFLSHNVNVLGMEFYNEPDNCAASTASSHPGDGPWFGPGGASPLQSDINKCVTWAASIHRQYRTAIVNKVANLGVSMPKIGGAVVSAAQSYAQTWAKDFSSGAAASGATWPYSDGNWNYFDTLSFHPYQRGSTNQGILNSIYYNPAQSTIDSASSIGLSTMSFLNNISRYFAAQGHATKKLAYNEYGDGTGNAFSGLVEVAHAIIGFGWQAQFGIDYISTWSGNRSTDSGDYPICANTSYSLNTRACAMRDLVFYFSRNYKRVVNFAQSGSNTPSSGDSGGNNNAVPRLPWVAGLNSDGSKLAVLVANIDLTNSEAFTFSWSNRTASGSGASFRQLLSTTTTSGSTPLPTGTQALTGQSFTRTLEAGSAYLFEIPLIAAGTPAPVNTVAPAVTGTTTQGQVLSCTTGTWNNSPTSYGYQWRRSGTAINGATSSTYTLVVGDVGSTIDCLVTATNSGGSTTQASNSVGPIISSSSFPSTAVLDSFDRANGAVGANWALVQGATITPIVSSNQLTEGTS